MVKPHNKFVLGICAAIFFSLSAGGLNAHAQTCDNNPTVQTTLDCAQLRSAVLYSVRHKRQGVSLPVKGSRAAHSQQTRSANKIYKEFLHWTAARDQVTIGNLLSEAQRRNFDPNSHESEGYTVAWLNIPSVDMDAYYDEFWARRSGQSGQVVMTYQSPTSNQTALRD